MILNITSFMAELELNSKLSISRFERYPELGRNSSLTISRVEKYPELGRN